MNVEVTLLEKRRRDGLVSFTVKVPDLEPRELDISFEALRRFCGANDPLALDFLLVASTCYVVDKMAKRAQSADGWTRELEVSLPVSDPQLWNGVADDFAKMLGFLTSDNWQLSFTKLDVPHWEKTKKKPKSEDYQADAVCLFSGGLDSLTGALNVLKSQPTTKLLLVGHHDGQAKEQTDLYDIIKTSYPDRERLLRVRVGHNPRSAPETTLRSRSLVFMSLGIYAARSYGEKVPLYAPENGVIALNIPLTPSRVGACSTRTMHPFFLDSLRAVLGKLGVSNLIINPLEFATKGECLKQCRDLPLLKKLAPLSVSCSHATRRQIWHPSRRATATNCGYCVPCLFRRAAMHQIGADDGLHYGLDVCQGELSPDDSRKSADDLRAMLDFLSGDTSPATLQEMLDLVTILDEVSRRAAMASRGFEEVRALIRDKGTAKLQKAMARTLS